MQELANEKLEFNGPSSDLINSFCAIILGLGSREPTIGLLPTERSFSGYEEGLVC